MALTVNDLKAQLNITGDGENAILTRLLAVAQAHVERLLGFKLAEQFPPLAGPPPVSTVPADLEHAVYMLAADLYENREASLVGVSAQAVPFGVAEIVNEYRNYTFGYVEVNDG